MTDQRYPKPTRRSVLASIGAGAAFTFGSTRVHNVLPSSSDAQYTNYTLAETHGPNILVGWYSTVNGELNSGSPVDRDAWGDDSTGEYIDDAESVLGGSPAVDVGNALPGDSGTLNVGLFVAPDSENGRIWMRLDGEGGSLGEVVGVRVWYGTGIFRDGGCQGAENGTPTDTTTPENATLASPGQLTDGIELNSEIFRNGEINAGDRICVALEWSFPVDAGNSFQNTVIDLDLEFVAVSADYPTNPFNEVV